MKNNLVQHICKFSLLSSLLVLVQGALWSAPADRVLKFFTQPDGSTLTIVLQGDEHFNYHTTTDGFMLFQDDEGYLKYAIVTEGYNFAISSFVAHDPAERNAEERSFLASLSMEDFKNAVYKRRETSPLRESFSRGTFPSKGSPKGLVILVQYKDVKFQIKEPQKAIHAQMNEKGYNKGKATGSALDYFSDQSHGQFTPIFDVFGPITLKRPMAYYGQKSYLSNDAHAPDMVKEACEQLSEQNIDFSQYDNDNDGVVDLVFIIYAGYSEAQGGPSAAIWPHAWTMTEAGYHDVKLGTIKVDRYACTSELKGASGVFLDGIGTFCHEFTHCFGLPDFYDTAAIFTGNYGVGRWSLMDCGSYNNSSHTPAGYTSYERMFVGWLEPRQLTQPTLITLNPINTHNEACIIHSDANKDEYFLIENRQKNGWDSYLPGNGLMITHVDYSRSAWETNSVNRTNSTTHPRFQIVAADNSPSYNSEADDLFPGPLNKTEFTDHSIPAATLHGGGYLGKPITGITEKDQQITFSFMGGTVDTQRQPTREVAISLGKGVLHLTMEQGQEVYIYDLAGQEIAHFISVEGRNTLPLAMGNYIVQIGREGYKIIVP
ncbi:M6 family metalloprotease domain-containing protein [Porphyromonas circumdentaria]|uniref:M6 family metalloprotease domain-containing protein n=1 Tax=Porphyromonas circumdentaria TaxID=29524 RepID=UPI0026DB59A6|nr:M6 family metalloprotease domain-containing protein [Porphyromonas circumdentaria]MDO4723050.1 M6 family metalloprotease domain-containing protein [Porphyromonas circumdentaria]